MCLYVVVTDTFQFNFEFIQSSFDFVKRKWTYIKVNFNMLEFSDLLALV